VTTGVSGATIMRTTLPSNSSMPAPTQISSGATPCASAKASRSSKLSESPYQLISETAFRIASAAFGEMPKALSFAPMRARKVNLFSR